MSSMTRADGPVEVIAAKVLLADSEAFDARKFAGGLVRSDTTGTFVVNCSMDGTDDPYEAGYDQDNSPMTLTLTAEKKKELPAWWFSLRFVKLSGVAATVKFGQKA